MFYKLITSLLFLVIISTAGATPNRSALKTELEKTLLSPWEIESLKIEAQEAVGTKTEPVQKYRLVGEFKPNQDLFKQLGKILNVPVLMLSREKNAEKTIHIIGTSFYRNGKWATVFVHESYLYRGEGKAINNWPKYVLRDSAEFDELITEGKKQLSENKDELKRVKAELLTVNEKYKTAQSSSKTLKAALRQQKLALRDEKRKISYANGNNEYKSQLTTAKQTMAAKIKTANQETRTKKKAINAEYNKNNKKLKSEIKKISKIKRKAVSKLKKANTKERLNAKKKLNEDEFAAFMTKANAQLETNISELERQYAIDIAPFESKRKMLKDENTRLNAERLSEFNTSKKSIIAEFDATRLKLKNEANQEKNGAIKDIEKNHSTSIVATEKQIESNKNEIQLYKSKKDDLVSKSNSLRRRIQSLERAISSE